MQRRLVKLIITLAVAACGIGFLVYSSIGHTQYYKTVDELMASPIDSVGKTGRVHGYVESGSIEERIIQQKTVRTFVLENKGKRIMVRHEGPAPDTFKDKSEVVARGKVIEKNGEYSLQATEIMAKCPSKYQGVPVDKELAKSSDKRVFDY